MNKFCQYCGKELSEGQDVCLGCGKAVNRTNSQTVVTVNPNKVKHNGIKVDQMVVINSSFVERVLKKKIKRKLDLYLEYIVSLTDNDALDTLPKVSVNNNEISVVWLKKF